MGRKDILFKVIAGALFITSYSTNAQSIQDVDRLTKKNQVCLDSGIDMLGCSKKFFAQMDSVLNVAYKSLRNGLSEQKKAALKQEQLQWLKKRDAFFKKSNQEFQKKYSTGEWGSDMAMVTYGDQADFVKQRVIQLIKRLEHSENQR
jgi:uncharacterized protein YecT (DUF1311 family)